MLEEKLTSSFLGFRCSPPQALCYRRLRRLGAIQGSIKQSLIEEAKKSDDEECQTRFSPHTINPAMEERGLMTAALRALTSSQTSPIPTSLKIARKIFAPSPVDQFRNVIAYD